MHNITDADEDSNANYKSLNSDNKNRASNRKIKPIQYGANNQNKNILKVVHENDSMGSGSHSYLPKNNNIM